MIAITGIAIGGATLLVTVWMLMLSKKEIPWAMDKKEGDIWEITRTGRKPAFIDEVFGEGMCWQDYSTQWIGQGGIGSPHKEINYGEKLLIAIVPNNPEYPVRSSIYLCYTEKDLPTSDKPKFTKSNQNPSHSNSSECANKHWSRPLY